MISIVIPAYNEESAIAETIEEIEKVFSSMELIHEVIIVDDGSSDQTAKVAEACGARVLRNPHNIGYGGSIKAGARIANHDTIVITDADGTYPLKEIPNLFREYEKGYDMVVGARSGKAYRGSMFKILMRFILRFLVEWTAGRRIPDINSGLRIFSRTTMHSYDYHLCNTFSFTTSLTLAYMMTGRFVAYVPIEYAERIGDSKVRMWGDSLRTLQFIIQAITYYNPLKIFLLMSLLCMVLSVINITAGFYLHLATPLMLGAGAFLVGIVVFSLGLLADLLRQILVK